MREIHWFESAAVLWKTLTVETWHPVCYAYEETQEAILTGEPVIYTTQPCAISTDTMDCGYRLFLHFCNGKVFEVK